jgi:hypothetical protein
MTPSEKRKMWVDYVEASPPGYVPSALVAVLRSEGRDVLSGVLKDLGLTLSTDLIERHAKEL